MTRPKANSEAEHKSFPSFVSVLWAASQSRFAGLADTFAPGFNCTVHVREVDIARSSVGDRAFFFRPAPLWLSPARCTLSC